MAAGSDREEWLAEFGLSGFSEILYHDRKGNRARRRGEYDTAREQYQAAKEETEEYLDNVKTIRETEDLCPDQREQLNEIESRLEQFQGMLKNQLDRL